eukprot:m.133057 g.133057  ORF g.133057 m.133057 type:complete len:1086 (-) comp11349_c0_seq1:1419-4676(-)
MKSLYGSTPSAADATQVIDQLKELLKNDNVSVTDHAVTELRHRVQSLLGEALMSDIQSASSGLVDKHLWHYGYYIHIDMYRQHVKRSEDRLAAADNDSDRATASLRRKSAVRGLKALLLSAIGFYTALLHGLCERYRLKLPGVVMQTGTPAILVPAWAVGDVTVSAVDRRYAAASSHCAMLHLGDLSRYLQLHCTARPQWTVVKRYYTSAMTISPQSGAPHGQLAIVAGLEGDHFTRAYHYARAALAVSPSAPAGDNLVRLYNRVVKDSDKRRRANAEHGSTSGSSRRSSSSVSSTVAGTSSSAAVRCLDGLIEVHARILAGPKATSKNAADTFDTTRSTAVAKLRDALRAEPPILPRDALQKLFCISVFSLHHTAGRDRGGIRSQRAVALMLDLFTCVLGAARHDLQHRPQQPTSSSMPHTRGDGKALTRDDPCGMDSPPALAAARVIARWLRAHVWCWCSSPDMSDGAPLAVREHPCWSALATLLNTTTPLRQTGPTQTLGEAQDGDGAHDAKPGPTTTQAGIEVDRQQVVRLAEDVNLMGFAPAVAMNEHCGGSASTNVGMNQHSAGIGLHTRQVEGDHAVARTRQRLQDLYDIALFLATSLGDKPDERVLVSRPIDVNGTASADVWFVASGQGVVDEMLSSTSRLTTTHPMQDRDGADRKRVSPSTLPMATNTIHTDAFGHPLASSLDAGQGQQRQQPTPVTSRGPGTLWDVDSTQVNVDGFGRGMTGVSGMLPPPPVSGDHDTGETTDVRDEYDGYDDDGRVGTPDLPPWLTEGDDDDGTDDIFSAVASAFETLDFGGVPSADTTAPYHDPVAYGAPRTSFQPAQRGGAAADSLWGGSHSLGMSLFGHGADATSAPLRSVGASEGVPTSGATHTRQVPVSRPPPGLLQPTNPSTQAALSRPPGLAAAQPNVKTTLPGYTDTAAWPASSIPSMPVQAGWSQPPDALTFPAVGWDAMSSLRSSHGAPTASMAPVFVSENGPPGVSGSAGPPTALPPLAPLPGIPPPGLPVMYNGASGGGGGGDVCCARVESDATTCISALFVVVDDTEGGGGGGGKSTRFDAKDSRRRNRTESRANLPRYDA